MFTNYLKVALRNLLRRKGYFFNIVAGLAVGMACCILILLNVQHELSFDRYHANSERIYRLVAERKAREGTSMDVATPPPLALALLNDFPQINQATRFLSVDNPTPLISNRETRFYEKRFFFVDPSVFEVFTIPYLAGDQKTALQKPNSVVIAGETAKRYFGEESPLGKTLIFNNDLKLEVTGVVKNAPATSTLQFDFLASFSTLYGWLGKEFVDNWQNNMCQSFVLLSENSSTKALEPLLPGFIEKHLSESNTLQKIHFQPLNRIHLFSFQEYGLPGGGDIQQVYLLSLVAVFVLLIACVNFNGLTTARMVPRSKEVGIRKLIGAERRQLVYQFLQESLLLVIIAVFLAIGMVELSIPYLDALIGIDLAANSARNWWMWLGPITIVSFVGFLSGSYPAFVLSSLGPISSLKGQLKTGPKAVLFRKGSVVFQFTLTITLIIATWAVHNQLDFIQNKNLGFDKDQVVVAPIRDQSLRQNPDPIKNRLLQRPGVLMVGAAALLPGGPVGKTRFRAQGIADERTMSMLWVDRDFVKTLNIHLVAGRDFSEDFATDASEGFILNEEAVRQLGWSTPDDAIGKSFELPGSKKGTIIGVVKNFNFVSLRGKIDPLVLHLWPWLNYILVRVDPHRSASVLSDMMAIWNEFDPRDPFTYSFLNENFDRFYQNDKRLGQVFLGFAFLAIVIACSGLFSLSAFTAEQRTKEIGVRKVLGASAASVVGLLTREFVLLVLLANLFAVPVAYFAMNRWLQDFAYRITLGVGTFLLAGGLALVIALLTVSAQTIKTAMANPVDALRYE